jgi:hypothetical protein
MYIVQRVTTLRVDTLSAWRTCSDAERAYEAAAADRSNRKPGDSIRLVFVAADNGAILRDSNREAAYRARPASERIAYEPDGDVLFENA